MKARHAGCCQTCDCIQVGQRRSLQGGLIAQLRNSDIANAINQNKGHKLWRLHHVWGSGWAPQGAVVGKSTSWRGGGGAVGEGAQQAAAPWLCWMLRMPIKPNFWPKRRGNGAGGFRSMEMGGLSARVDGLG